MGRRGLRSYLFTWMTVAAAGLAQGGEGQIAPPQPSIELPGELARVLREYEEYWSTGQEEHLAALFVEEGLIARNGSWLRGRAAIRDAYRSASGPLRLRAVEYATDGDVGFIVGAYGYGDGPSVPDVGLFVLALRRDATGRWLIVTDLDRGAG